MLLGLLESTEISIRTFLSNGKSDIIITSTTLQNSKLSIVESNIYCVNGVRILLDSTTVILQYYDNHE